MSTFISGAQVRAARALLGWSQLELSHAAGVGEASVKRFENTQGDHARQTRVMFVLKEALEEAGIVFLPEEDQQGSGVRFRKGSRNGH